MLNLQSNGMPHNCAEEGLPPTATSRYACCSGYNISGITESKSPLLLDEHWLRLSDSSGREAAHANSRTGRWAVRATGPRNNNNVSQHRARQHDRGASLKTSAGVEGQGTSPVQHAEEGDVDKHGTNVALMVTKS